MSILERLCNGGLQIVAVCFFLGAAAIIRPAQAQQAPPPKRELRVYYIGNSLTGSIIHDRLQKLFAERGIVYQYGSQMTAGGQVSLHWNYRNAPPGKRFGGQESQPFGLYDKALAEHEWDVLVLQPFEEPLGKAVEACANFIEFARRRSPKIKVVLLAGYPRRFDFQKTGISTVDIRKAWATPYDYALEDTSHNATYVWCNRAYFTRLQQLLKERVGGEAPALVKFAESLIALDEAIRAGRLPGLAELAARRPEMLPGWKEGPAAERGANILYADNFHLNPLPHTKPTLGIYAVALTLFAGLSGESPVGLSGAAYDLDDKEDAELIRAVQQIVEQAALGVQPAAAAATPLAGRAAATTATAMTTVAAPAAATAGPARPEPLAWRKQVAEKRVAQFADSWEGVARFPWRFDELPLPPVAEIAAQMPDRPPVYGVYQWGGEYLTFRDDIRKVGWSAYRCGGPVIEPALIAMMEDGIEVLYCIQVGALQTDLGGKHRRDQFDDDESFIAAYLKDIDLFCERYGPGGGLFRERPDLADRAIRHLEIWNEPNFQYMIKDPANPADRPRVVAERDRLYAKVLRAAGELIRRKYPKMVVVGFGAGGAAADDARFVRAVFELDPKIGECFDILSTHPYSDSPPTAWSVRRWGRYTVASMWQGIRGQLGRRGFVDKPIWYTEVGWSISHADGGVYEMPRQEDEGRHFSAMQQAVNVVKLYALSLRLGVRRAHIMSVADIRGYNSGFFHRNTKEWRPSAHAAQQMIRRMPRPRLVDAPVEQPKDGLFAWRFQSDWTKADAPEVILAWRETDPGEIAVPLPAGRTVAEVQNLFGGPEPFRVEDGRVLLPGGPAPCYIVLR